MPDASAVCRIWQLSSQPASLPERRQWCSTTEAAGVRAPPLVQGGLDDAAGRRAAGVCRARHLGGLDAGQHRLRQARLKLRADHHLAAGEVPDVLSPAQASARWSTLTLTLTLSNTLPAPVGCSHAMQNDTTHLALTYAGTAWSAGLPCLAGQCSGGEPRRSPLAPPTAGARLRESEYSWLRSVNRLSASASCTPRAARASRCVKPCRRMRASSVRITCGAAARPAVQWARAARRARARHAPQPARTRRRWQERAAGAKGASACVRGRDGREQRASSASSALPSAALAETTCSSTDLQIGSDATCVAQRSTPELMLLQQLGRMRARWKSVARRPRALCSKSGRAPPRCRTGGRSGG